MSENSNGDELLFDHANFYSRVEGRKKKKSLLFITQIVFFVLIWASLLVYILTPLGKVGQAHIEGNYYLSQSEVLNYAKIKKSTLLVSVNKEEIEDRLNANSRIQNASVKWSPFSLSISFNEIVPIAKIDDSILLSNGSKYEVFILNNDYDLDPSTLHLAQFVNSPFLGNIPQVKFLESLKILEKGLFNKTDYLDITRIGEDDTLYYGIYVKVNDDEYIRIRTTHELLAEIYDNAILSVVINAYDQFIKNTDEVNKITYYDAVCSRLRQSNENKIQCLRTA